MCLQFKQPTQIFCLYKLANRWKNLVFLSPAWVCKLSQTIETNQHWYNCIEKWTDMWSWTWWVDFRALSDIGVVKWSEVKSWNWCKTKLTNISPPPPPLSHFTQYLEILFLSLSLSTYHRHPKSLKTQTLLSLIFFFLLLLWDLLFRS